MAYIDKLHKDTDLITTNAGNVNRHDGQKGVECDNPWHHCPRTPLDVGRQIQLTTTHNYKLFG